MIVKPWRILDSRYLIRDPWLKLRADRCQLPSGVLIEPYYVQESPDWVQVVAFDAMDDILTVKQYRHAAGVVCTELPGGTIEDGEVPEQAMRRELLEETGCTADRLVQIGTLYPNPARDHNRLHVFVATGTHPVQEQQLEATEMLEWTFLSLTQVLSLIDCGNFPQALHVAGFFLALRSRQMLPATYRSQR